MADTFTTSLSIRQIETGTRSGTWGSETNTQYELLDNAFSYVNHDLSSDADATLTISDGTASDARYFYIKFTSAVSLTATRSITLAPDDSKKIWIVENATTGSQSLTFKQGSSGGTVTVVNGNTAIIYANGAGATNGAITNALNDLQIDGNLTVDTNTLYVDSTNNRVGIGETTPLGKLHIKGTDVGATASAQGNSLILEDTENGLSILSSTVGAGYINFGDSDDNNVGMIIYGHSSNAMNFWTNASNRMTIDSAGKVGIANTSPSSYSASANNLVVGSSGDTGITIVSSTVSNGQLKFADGTTGDETGRGIIDYNHATDSMALKTAATERMRITSSGMLGLGSIPPTDSHATWSQFFIGEKGSVISEKLGSGGLFGIYLTDNLYVDNDTGSFSYRTTDEASAYRLEAGQHQFYTVASGTAGTTATLTERMIIDSSGDVGIGISSPGAGLQVNRGTSGAAAVSGTTQNGTLRLSSAATSGIIDIGMHGATPWIQATDSTALNNNYTIVLNPNGGNVGIGRYVTAERLHVAGNVRVESSGADSAVRIVAPSDSYSPFLHWAVAAVRDSGVLGFPAGSDALVYRNSGANNMTTGTERLRVLSSGALCVGITAAVTSSTVAGCFRGNGTDGTPALDIAKLSGTTSSSAYFISFHASSGGTGMGAIAGNGPANVQFIAVSDERLKENIQPLSGSLDKVLALNPVSYDWKENGEHIEAGFVAQEVEQVLPEYVSTKDDENQTKSLTGGMTAGYIAVLTKAIQEQQVLIEQLQAEVALLKGE